MQPKTPKPQAPDDEARESDFHEAMPLTSSQPAYLSDLADRRQNYGWLLPAILGILLLGGLLWLMLYGFNVEPSVPATTPLGEA